ncbi:MAG: hypothetical protein WC974_01605 [Thermoplasmata archaeon]
MNKIVIVGLCLVLVVTFSGCIGTPSFQEKKIDNLRVEINIDANETKNTSISTVKLIMEQKGYVVEEHYVNSTLVGVYGNKLDPYHIFVSVLTNTSSPSIFYHQTYTINETQLEQEKQKIKTEIEDIGAHANLTIDWNKATWEIGYRTS